MKARRTYHETRQRARLVLSSCAFMTLMSSWVLTMIPTDRIVLAFVPLQVPSSRYTHKNIMLRNSLTSRSVKVKRTLFANKKPTQEGKKKSLTIRPTFAVPPQVAESIQNVLVKLAAVFPALRTGFLSFLAGALITAASIFVPVYQSMDTLSQPVALFETILSDLDRAYVEKVDTNKLFETGIQAMLRSLDPYTEFEGKTEAIELSESVNGKYGGIGLVISGPVLPKAVTEAVSLEAQNKDSTNRSPLTSSDPNEEDGDESTTSPDAYNIRREIQKARDRGIRVVSAFEGYAFDYGLRTGDKIVAIDGVRVDPLTPINTRTVEASSTGSSILANVEQVRNKLRGEPGSQVRITFERDGLTGENTVIVPRTIVQLRDVKLATLVGNPEDRIGYIQLTGFSGSLA